MLQVLRKAWDEGEHPRDERGRFGVAGGGDETGPDFIFPDKPGTAAVPEGNVRLYHQTGEDKLEQIGQQGIMIESARGIEGPKAIYADEQGFYGDPEHTPSVEFHVSKDRWQPPFVTGENVKPGEIIALHRPWHSSARYIEANPETLRQVVAGEHDDLKDDRRYGPAIRYLQAKYGRVEKEWDESLHPRDEAGRFGFGGGGADSDDGGGGGKGEHPGKGYSKGAYVDSKGVIQTKSVYDAQRALHEDRKVELDQPRKVSVLLQKLGETAAKMIKQGKEAPVVNLCNVSVKGTNLFCADTKGIPRVEMPQLDKQQTKDFQKYLKAQGYKVTKEKQLASHLRATQNELNGAKVARTAEKIAAQGGKPKSIIISKDDYILDGHHAWAAKLGLDAMDNKLENDSKMNVHRVNISITKLLAEAEKFTGGKGHKAADESESKKSLGEIVGELVRDWDESLHPRDDAGRFGFGGGGASDEGSTGERVETSAPPISDADIHAYNNATQSNHVGTSSDFDFRPERPMPAQTGIITVNIDYDEVANHRDIPLSINPTVSEIKAIARESEGDTGRRAARVMLDSAGNIYVWPAGAALHADVMDALPFSENYSTDQWALKGGRLVSEYHNDSTEPVKEWLETSQLNAKTADVASVGFVSPNVRTDLSFAGAVTQLDSEQQAALVSVSAEIDRALGIRAKETNTIGAWLDGAENSVMMTAGSDYDTATLAMVMKGFLADQKSVVVFQQDNDASDGALISFKATGSLEDIHKGLIEDGLEYHTLVPGKDGATVYIVDTDGTLGDAAKKGAERYESKVTVQFGNARFIGDTKDWTAEEAGTGTEREQRDRARGVYENLIRELAVGGRAEVWAGIRDRWSKAHQEVKGVRYIYVRSSLVEAHRLISLVEASGGIEIIPYDGPHIPGTELIDTREWDEGEHPRDERGRFGFSGSGSEGTEATSTGGLRAATGDEADRSLSHEDWNKPSLQDAVYGKLLDATGGGPFAEGSVVMAQAIQKVKGGALTALVDANDIAQHVVVQHGLAKYSDYAGTGTKDEVISHFNEHENVEIVGIRPLTDSDLPTAPRNDNAATELAAIIDPPIDGGYDSRGRWREGPVTDVKPKDQVIERGENKSGQQVALVHSSTPITSPHPNGGFIVKYQRSYAVSIRKGHYDGHVPGGIRYTWGIIKQYLSKPDAEKLFARRTKDWDESLHPRDDHGRFGSGGGGSESDVKERPTESSGGPVLHNGPLPKQSIIIKTITDKWGNQGRSVEVLINPTHSEALQFTRESEFSTIRYLQDKHENIFVWKAEEAIHAQALKALQDLTSDVEFTTTQEDLQEHVGPDLFLARGDDRFSQSTEAQQVFAKAQENAKRAEKEERDYPHIERFKRDLKDWSESAHPREPAGSAGGGQFAGGATGGETEAEAPSAANDYGLSTKEKADLKVFGGGIKVDWKNKKEYDALRSSKSFGETLDKLPKQTGTFYRGMVISKKEAAQFTSVDKTIDIAKHSFASPQRDYAKAFTQLQVLRGPKGSVPIVLSIKNANAVAFGKAGYGASKNRLEVVLPIGGKIKVTSVKEAEFNGVKGFNVVAEYA